MVGKRGMKGFNIESLPYTIRVYSNYQVLIPARLVRKLGIQKYKFAKIKIKIGDNTVVITARLLRTRFTDSRQFTVPKEIRSKYGIKPGERITILEIEPVSKTG